MSPTMRSSAALIAALLLATPAVADILSALDGAFSVSPDGDWVRVEGRSGISLACAAHVCRGERVVCTANPNPEPQANPGTPLPEREVALYAEGIQGVRPAGVRFELVAPVTPRSFGKTPGHWLELRAFVGNRPPLRMTAFLFAVRGHAVAFNCDAPDAGWDDAHKSKVERLLASLKVAL